MNITEITNFEDKCTGCEACKNICPKNAIKMTPNYEGFLYPNVSSDCINCGKCVSVCQIQIEPLKKQPKAYYSCQIKDQNMLIKSTSGGLFPLLATQIIKNKGVVYGASYDENMVVVHSCATKEEDIYKFSGSKYVQSRIGEVYLKVEKNLKEGRMVLFSGTPCQIFGLKNYLVVDYKFLFTIDVICYGVPSPKLFKESINSFETINHAKVIDYKFRDKHTNGWSHTTVITFLKSDNTTFKKEIENHSNIPYYKAFAYRNCFRKSCYDCSFNTIERVSDITMGNFWGIEKSTKLYDTTKGVSMAIINSSKGLQLFNDASSKMIFQSQNKDEILSGNDALYKKTSIKLKDTSLYSDIKKYGYNKAMKKHYYDKKIARRILSKAKRIIYKIFKKDET